MNIELGRRLAAEFIGTFALIFMGAGAAIAGIGLVGEAFAHGLAIAVMVTALGHISGGVFNPALTVGLWATRRMTSLDAAAYVLAQLAGATAAAAMLMTFPQVLRNVSTGVPDLAGVTFIQGTVIEAVLTFFLMIAVFGTAIDRRGPRVGGFAIGLVITMDIFAAGRITGAVMNPARAFGPELIFNQWNHPLVYWIGPIIGAVLAALVYHYLFLDEEQRAEAAA